jgi:hypothetical protein
MVGESGTWTFDPCWVTPSREHPSEICVLRELIRGKMFPLTKRLSGDSVHDPPATCPDGIVKNSKVWLSL